MRQLRVTVPKTSRDALVDVIDHHDGHAVRLWHVISDGEEQICAELSLTNGEIGDFLEHVDALGEDVGVTMAPQSVLTLVPGRDEAPQDLVDVQSLSPQEVYLAGLQSVGSWSGFLGYAAVAGAVVWIGLLIESVFLLVAAMLIAPFAGPAMNAALATATGDRRLLGRSVLRYAGAISLLIVVAAVLHAVLGTEIATNAMTDTANISQVAVVLPLVAGAAGALNLMQAERSSLVSGAATGVLVASALAPPAGLVGMAAVIGEWSMVKAGAFLLVLQLGGLNVAGALVFRLYGVRPRNARYGRGDPTVSVSALVASAVSVVALVAWQLHDAPSLQRSSVQEEISADISQVVNQDPDAGLVEVDARFTRPDIPGQDTLLAVVYVQPRRGVDADGVERRLSEQLSQIITERYEVVALVTVSALEPAAGAG